MTRSFCSGMPVASGQHDPQDVRDLGGRPDRQLAARSQARRPPRAVPSPPGSAAAGRYRRLTTTSASRTAGRRHVAVGERDPVKHLLRALVRVDQATPSASAVLHVDHRGQRLVVDLDRRRARRPRRSRSRATTTATASPTWRTSSVASGGCVGITMSGVTGQAQGSTALLVGEVRAAEGGDHAGQRRRGAQCRPGRSARARTGCAGRPGAAARAAGCCRSSWSGR